MARRMALTPGDKRLLERLRRGRWTVDELQWVLRHLDERAPTLVVQEIYARMHEPQPPSAVRTEEIT